MTSVWRFTELLRDLCIPLIWGVLNYFVSIPLSYYRIPLTTLPQGSAGIFFWSFSYCSYWTISIFLCLCLYISFYDYLLSLYFSFFLSSGLIAYGNIFIIAASRSWPDNLTCLLPHGCIHSLSFFTPIAISLAVGVLMSDFSVET